MSEKNINYFYKKVRKNFGRQPMFSMVPHHMLCSILPDEREHQKYCLKNPVDRESQASTSQKEHYANTKSIILKEQGINHYEGGWPNDIYFKDEESTARYRRRYERDDSYIQTVLGSQKNLLHYIKQNNAIEMYETFYKGMLPATPVEKTSLIVNNIYKDEFNRKIASLSWTFEDDAKLVATYCDKTFPITRPVNQNLSCYVWNLENPKIPVFEFLPPTACWQATCSLANPSLIIGGLEDGRVCLFDIRNQNVPVMISPEHLAHRDPITALVNMQSRLNIEFFSGSTDGSCLWWDLRNLSYPTDCLIMSVKVRPGEQISLANAEGVTTLQYDRAFPSKFLCGTDTGLVVDVNRRGKNHNEIMRAVYEAHLGPVRTVQRSPCTSKMFITCGDWTVHVWSDEVYKSPIITGTPQRHSINDVAWTPKRLSSYMSVSTDGVFRYWDLLRKRREPVKSFRLSKHPLLKLEPHREGQLIAIGDEKGMIYLLSLSESLVMSGNQDKQFMLQMHERESRRENILEARVKEILLKQIETLAVGPAGDEKINDDARLIAAEEEYKRIVSEQQRGIGILFPPQIGSMRQR